MTATASQTPAGRTARARRVEVWDLPLRLFHWLLVAAVAVAFLSAEEGSPLNQWHVLAGWIAGILIVFRLVWGFVGGEHSRFADFIRPSQVAEHISGLVRRRTEPTLGHNPLGGISVVVLLVLTAATVWTGAFGGEGADEMHELIAWALLAFVGLHILAVIVMSFLERENLVRAMVTGSKSGDRHAGAANARRPSPFGLAVGAIVLAGTVYGILQYDPKAFTLRPAEAFENRDGNSGNATSVEREDAEPTR